MFNVLLYSCVSVSSSYTLLFPFLGICEQNLSSGSASIPACLKGDFIIPVRHHNASAAEGQGGHIH